MLRYLAGALLCVVIPLAAGAAPVSDAAQKTLAADYQLLCTASQDPTDANLTSAFAMLAPDFVQIDFKNKQTSRDEFVARTKQQIKQIHITSCQNTIASASASDANTIVVVVTGKLAGQLQAPDGNHDLEVTSSAQDTWKLQNSTWLQTQSKDVSALVKIDGKVVQDEGN